MIERTLSIIKPDAVRRGAIGEILTRFNDAGLRLIATRLVRLSAEEAAEFYAVHRGKPFYKSLVEFMSSGPILVSVLEGDDAIGRLRTSMGATDPIKAAAGSIRRDFGTDVEKNATHGSDGVDTARWEIGFFFGERDLLRY